MTQDQYGQAQDAGYGNRGDVVEDEDEGKHMTRFQKVASALRGDRPDRDEDEVDANQADTVSPEAGGSSLTGRPDLATDSDVTAAGDPSWVSHPAQTATAGPQRGDYWEVPNAREDQVGAVTNPDTPVTDTHTDPLAGQETVEQTHPDLPDHQAPLATQAGEYETPGGTAGDTVAGDSYPSTVAGDGYADTTGDTVPGDSVPGDTVAGDSVPGDTVPGDSVPEDSVPGDTVPEDSVPGDTVAGDTVPGDRSDTVDEAGAATIADAPVTQAPDEAVGTEAVGRHAAAAPGDELRPGEATGTLEDLGDLAYGNLIPDASHFTDQWQQIQFRFVDDPQASVTEAAEVVAQVTAKLEAAIQERQRAIEARQQAIQERQRSLRDRWGEGAQADTETLRETLRMYRAFLDQLIGPKA